MDLFKLLFKPKGKLERAFPLNKWKNLKSGDVIFTKTGTERLVIDNDNGRVALKGLRKSRALVVYYVDHRDLFRERK